MRTRGEKIIEGHSEGRTRQQRAWFAYWHTVTRIINYVNSLKSPDDLRFIRRQMTVASRIRNKYDPV